MSGRRLTFSSLSRRAEKKVIILKAVNFHFHFHFAAYSDANPEIARSKKSMRSIRSHDNVRLRFSIRTRSPVVL